MITACAVAGLVGAVPSQAAVRDLHVLYVASDNWWAGVETDGDTFAVANRSSGPISQKLLEPWKTILDPGCRIAQPRLASALARCGEPSGPVDGVVNLSTPASFSPLPPAQPGDLIGEIGRYWVGGTQTFENAPPVQLYINRATGERVTRPYGDGRLLDLDQPTLNRPMPPLMQGDTLLGRPDARWATHLSKGLRLRRSGAVIVVRDRCHPDCRGVQLGGGWITWSEGRTAFGFRIRDGRTVRWAPTATQINTYKIRYYPLVAHTRARIYASYRRGGPGNAIPGGVDLTAILP